MKQECGNCKYYLRGSSKKVSVEDGFCRRFPPKISDLYEVPRFDYPHICYGWWCGEWKKKGMQKA